MEVQLVRRPAASCSRHAFLLSSSALLSPSAASNQLRPAIANALRGTRHKSSTSRTKRALNIAPHPSFLASPADASDPATATGSHIIFNPPSSAPSVYHTPFKFLPRSDPRRRANLAASLFSASTTIKFNHTGDSAAAVAERLPVVRPEPPKTYHLTEADVAEMRRLRYADPVTNSVTALATRYKCPKLFVVMCCHSPAKHQKEMAARKEAVKNKWGPRKTAAREERQRRKQMLLDGLL
ncbi:mitochondrial ribosomal protein subunit L20-domain-containing protein [Podospora aff. communis PSN243]|uniref:Mitochondrial ribosomal protein subunit L20-domain-containing protein n=1 Tax=Podospora aff. communis PSN243 TaxID=3040156 RepID=A0AAV9GZ69_9PEZI|nr:mitochondrial ribosomal protein subunit L20-domain-containing protein [Podospora aff. communis PSN243]